jgi:hypothetical protein
MTTTIPRPQAVPRPAYVSRLPFDDQRIGAAAVYCSDGRFGEQMDEFLHLSLKLPRYDRVAIPGGAGCLAGHSTAFWQKTALERELHFLIQAHNLSRIVLIAHDGCGFYKNIWTDHPLIETQQAHDLKIAADNIRLGNPGVEVEAYFARKMQGQVAFEKWAVH